MERIAVYGKGGIGKSTFATSASLVLSRMGNRVLHVGCDPKHDSSVVLVQDPTRFRTVMNKVFAGEEVIDPEDIIMPGIEGIDCVESGGPDAGRGCAPDPPIKAALPGKAGRLLDVWTRHPDRS